MPQPTACRMSAGCSHAHQIARLVRRQQRRGERDDGVLHLRRLAHADAPDGVPGERQRGDKSGRLAPQILVHASLHDPKHRLSVPTRLQAAGCPEVGAAHRVGGLVPRAGVGRALVERHAHVHPQLLLDLDRPLRRERHLRAVEVRAEADVLVGDRAPLRETHHLVAARVRQDRTAPPRELMQPSHPLHPRRGWAQGEMVRVRQHHLEPHPLQLFPRGRLDAPLRPHRHERGRLDRAVRRIQPPSASAGMGAGSEKLVAHS